MVDKLTFSSKSFNSADENFNVANINGKAGPPNREIGLPINSLFPYESKQPPFGRRHRF